LKNILKEIKQTLEFLIFISLLKIVSVFTFNQTSMIGSFLVGFFGRYSRYKKIISNNLNVLNFDKNLKDQLIINNLQQTGRVFF
jgi:hypothetical protein